MNISVEKIWDKGKHNAFTDLIRYNNEWFCAFREAASHQDGEPGTIRLIHSIDTTQWSSVISFKENDVDLRDPKLSVTPEGKLMLIMEGVNGLIRQPRVSFSSDGFNWEPITLCFSVNEWPWGVTWHQNKGYTVSYRPQQNKRWSISLCVTEDGIQYKKLQEWDISYYPSEARIRFQKSGEMIILLRQCGQENREWLGPNWIGTSPPPYTDCEWKVTDHHLGGPNFLILDQDKQVAAGRIIWPTPYGFMEKTVLAAITKTNLLPFATLPSGGDCGYPGMVYHDETLYVSYYSSHENNTAIYLAKGRLEI